MAINRIILCVTGGVAAYKACDLARRLMDKGFAIQIAMTDSAEKFVTPLTFEALTGEKVLRHAMPSPGEPPMPHITLLQGASAVVVAPATANVIGKMANGIADDMVTALLLAADVPLIVAPAMNTRMYRNPAVQANIKKLAEWGATFVNPASGTLACGEDGEGKLAPVEDIVSAVIAKLDVTPDMAGLRVIVTAGGTREPIDTVRYIGNRSSGKMGVAIASAASRRGAKVTLVSGAMETHPPKGVENIRVDTAEKMLKVVGEKFCDADILIMAAAVGDYRAQTVADGKVKKRDSWTITLTPNPDILAEMGKIKKDQTIVGFAAETDNAMQNGQEKLVKKNLDMIVVNDVSREDIGFGSAYNEIMIITKSGKILTPPRALKHDLADIILDTAMTVRSDGGK